MSALLPANTTIQDLCTEALREAGALGVGQTALAEDITGAWMRLQWMLQQWQNKRWMVYALQTLMFTSTGAQSYTVGPGSNYNTGTGNPRPAKLERAFLRQVIPAAPSQIDYPLELLQSKEDYDNIALKALTNSFPSCVFYDPQWPTGLLYPWPIPLANVYSVGITIRVALPTAFATLATVISLPYEYYGAILYNLALRLRPKYGIGTFPGDQLPMLAKDGLAVVRGANTAIAALSMPADINRPGIYNIFSDRSY